MDILEFLMIEILTILISSSLIIFLFILWDIISSYRLGKKIIEEKEREREEHK